MIVYSSSLFLPPRHHLAEDVRATAEIVNPAFLDHERMVRSGVRSRMAQKPPRRLKVWQEIPGGHPWATGTMIPRSWRPPLALRHRLERELWPHCSDPPLDTTATLAPGFTLRDYQADAGEAFAKVETGVVVMPCGAGKTSCGLGIIERLQRRTLILVHTKDLARQWVERIQGAEELPGQLEGVKVGTVGGGKKSSDVGAGIVVATVQTLAKLPWRELYEWGKGFGLVILDEAHHGAAESFLRVLSGLPARYRLGLTATPIREDGMGDLLWAAFGGVAFEAHRADLIAQGRIRPARLVHHSTGCTVQTHEVRANSRAPWVPIYPQEVRGWRDKYSEATGHPKVRPRRWNDQVDDLTRDTARNQLILDLAEGRVGEGHSVIILSERVAHCEALASALNERGIPAAAVAGRQSQRKVSQILARARRRELLVLCGTTKADEGLDVPVLSCGILATRTKKFGRLTQRIGRIERPEGLAGEWHDLIDDFPSAARSWSQRKKLYLELGLEGASWKRGRARRVS